MKSISQFFSRSTDDAPSSSSFFFSPFHRQTNPTEDDAGSSKPQGPGDRSEGQGETGEQQQQTTAGPTAWSDLQLNDLLADSFRNVRMPLVETDEDGEVVVDSSVCYAMDCQICEPVHECPALLRTLERVLTGSDGSFGFPFKRGAPTVESDSSSVEDGASSSGEVNERTLQAGRKEKEKEKGRSKANGGRRFSSWSKICNTLSQLLPHKSAPNLSTRNESPLAEGAAPTPSEPRFAKRFALLRRPRRKPASVNF